MNPLHDLDLVYQNLQYQHNRDRFCVQCNQNLHELEEYLEMIVLLQFSMMDLLLSMQYANLSHPKFLFEIFQFLRCRFEKVIAFQDDVRLLNAFLLESNLSSNEQDFQPKFIQMELQCHQKLQNQQQSQRNSQQWFLCQVLIPYPHKRNFLVCIHLSSHWAQCKHYRQYQFCLLLVFSSFQDVLNLKQLNFFQFKFELYHLLQ